MHPLAGVLVSRRPHERFRLRAPRGTLRADEAAAVPHTAGVPIFALFAAHSCALQSLKWHVLISPLKVVMMVALVVGKPSEHHDHHNDSTRGWAIEDGQGEELRARPVPFPPPCGHWFHGVVSSSRLRQHIGCRTIVKRFGVLNCRNSIIRSH